MATLKISELSVGDWVGIDQAELNMPSTDLASAYIEKLRKPIYVKGISEDSDIVLADIETVDGWGSIMLKCEHLKPIPITAEILKKNDFIRRSDEFGIYEYTTLLGKILRTTQVHLTAPQSINVFLHDTTIERGFYHREKTSVSILRDEVYVHDLQHALRLVGLDKKIYL